MKKYLAQVLIFGVVFLIPCFLLNVYHKKQTNDPPHYSQVFSEIEENQNNSNGIVIGSSQSGFSVKPSLLDIKDYKFYNFSMNGGGPNYFLNWYNHFFSKGPVKPKVCIYSVNSFMFEEGYLWRYFEVDSEYLSMNRFFKLFFNPKTIDTKLLIQNRIPLFKYRNNVFEKIQYFKYDLSTFDKGYISMETYAKSLAKYNPKNPRNFKFTEKQKNAFEDLIQHLQDDGIKVILVNTPEFGLNVEDYLDAQGMDYLISFSKQKNIPFINFNMEHRDEVFNCNAQNFSDWVHLSPQGSKIFSKELAKQVEIYLSN